MTNNPDDFLLGGGGKSAKFETVGAKITGTITVRPELRQQTDMVSGLPETWDGGDPKMQLVVSLQTDERDPEDPDDDGVRKVYVKGSKKPESKSLHAAIAQAVREAGAKGLEIGGRLTVTYVGDGVPTTRGFNPPKHYEASYVPAATNYLAGEQDLNSYAETVPPTAKPATDPAVAAALANLDPKVLEALAAQAKAS